MSPTRLLIADDSVVSRQLLKSTLSEVPDFEVVAVASNGKIALERIRQYRPDLVILDIEMPELNGLQVLQEIRSQYQQMPVIMFSAMTEGDAAITITALAMGADDCVAKPSTRERQSTEQLKMKLLQAFEPRIRALCPPTSPPHERSVHVKRARLKAITPLQVVGIGLSTGGPNALSQLLPDLPADFPVPIVVVQHMPPLFTRSLAERFNRTCALRTYEAEQGMCLEPGHIYVAPGDYHLVFERRGPAVVVDLNQAPPENSCRPAVDVTFRALAQIYGPAVLGVIMTGMGQDGLRGCEHLHAQGAQILAQDEASSTIWGMPGQIARAGLADKILPLNMLGSEINRRVRQA